MNEDPKVGILKEAGRYFSDASTKQFLDEMAKWTNSKGRSFYQISQEGSKPVLVVGQLEKSGMYNFVMQDNRTVVSFLPFGGIILTDFFKVVERSILRVHYENTTRPNQYFEYIAYDEESQRRLFLFSKTLVLLMNRGSHNE